ncbi:IS66 family insertion sequence element accessory protein TnpA [Paraburkholderia sp. A3BS-1L]|uniref:IS66 family insertion sequence element accessory protein TnpA n=1 Tax=Paraburkholderia sp. A3BS-1L TaxID=3028375 RepID=UPI003DA80165
MDNAKGGTAGPTGTRRPRQGEAFWREMVMTWEASGLGVRRFCRQQGLAVSTFGLWRKKLAGEISVEVNPLGDAGCSVCRGASR